MESIEIEVHIEGEGKNTELTEFVYKIYEELNKEDIIAICKEDKQENFMVTGRRFSFSSNPSIKKYFLSYIVKRI